VTTGLEDEFITVMRVEDIYVATVSADGSRTHLLEGLHPLLAHPWVAPRGFLLLPARLN
jgi:hypothetical protein